VSFQVVAVAEFVDGGLFGQGDTGEKSSSGNDVGCNWSRQKQE
jgi:hypothetical protein